MCQSNSRHTGSNGSKATTVPRCPTSLERYSVCRPQFAPTSTTTSPAATRHAKVLRCSRSGPEYQADNPVVSLTRYFKPVDGPNAIRRIAPVRKKANLTSRFNKLLRINQPQG